jgi:hypothetical protein
MMRHSDGDGTGDSSEFGPGKKPWDMEIPAP